MLIPDVNPLCKSICSDEKDATAHKEWARGRLKTGSAGNDHLILCA